MYDYSWHYSHCRQNRHIMQQSLAERGPLCLPSGVLCPVPCQCSTRMSMAVALSGAVDLCLFAVLWHFLPSFVLVNTAKSAAPLSDRVYTTLSLLPWRWTHRIGRRHSRMLDKQAWPGCLGDPGRESFADARQSGRSGWPGCLGDPGRGTCEHSNVGFDSSLSAFQAIRRTSWPAPA